MREAEYHKLADYETWYWWYRAERLIIRDTIDALAMPAPARVLDVGCGTGRNLVAVCDGSTLQGFALDRADTAVAMWPDPIRQRGCCGEANALPYADGSFDLALCIDVLQCAGVTPERAVREIARVLRPDGSLVVLAPAYQWMLSRHDDAVHGVRRFTARQLKQLARDAGLHVNRACYQFPTFFPVIAAVRLWRKRGRNKRDTVPTSDLFHVPAPVNAMLFAMWRMERWAVRRFGAPFGSTVLLLARKVR